MTQGAHTKWALRGFGADVISIIPPDAVLSPGSVIDPTQRGKTPGDLGRHGWRGLPGWQSMETTAADWKRWDGQGGSVGLKAARWPAIDIDVLDAMLSARFHRIATKMFGATLRRVGRSPKMLLIFALKPGAEPIPYQVVRWTDAAGVKHQIEIAGAGRQYVLEGIHPGTGLPYAWPDGEILDTAQIVHVDGADITRFLDAVRIVLDALGLEATVSTGGEGAEARQDLDQDARRAPSAEALTAAAPFVQNRGGYEDWIVGLAAFKAAGTGVLDDDGFALAAAWSDRWTGEGAGGGPAIDLDRKWSVLAPPFSVGWNWIEREARKGGWTGGAQADFGSYVADAIARGQVCDDPPEAPEDAVPLTVQEAMFRRYVWVKSIRRVCDRVTGEFFDREQFNVELNHVGPPHDSKRCAYAKFQADAKRCVRVDDVTYRPGAGVLVEEDSAGKRGRCFNTWQSSSLVPKTDATDDDVRPWLDLAAWLLPDAGERGWLLDWMAFLLQHPGVKPRFGVVLGGFEGIGKDSLVLPLQRALGARNVQNITTDDLASAQTDWVASAQLVVVGEMHSFSRREMSDKLKPLLAAPPETLRVNTKYLPQYRVPNIVAVMLFTNHRDALSISDSDRRLLCLWSPAPNLRLASPDIQEAAEAMFRAYHAWLEAGGAEAVGGWLLKRDTSAFLRLTRAPDTQAKAMMAREGRSDAVADLEDALEGMDLPDLVNPTDLGARIAAKPGWAGRAPSGRKVTQSLEARGAKLVTSTSVKVPSTALMSEAGRIHIWALRDADRYKAMRPAALARCFGEMWGATKQDIERTLTPQEVAR